MEMFIKGDWIGLIVFLLVCFTIAALASLVTRPEIPTWYAGLRKPPWTPPAWLFGPVWTGLYAAMAVAGWLVWHRAGWHGGRLALTLFALQLVLNGAWSFIFFMFHSVGWALADIVALWVAIAATIVTFAAVSLLSSLLLIPYLAWVTYAAALNLAIWRMNE
jgi:tryptophan-rich sensory protein